jgi:hypothetical protein
MKFLASSCCCCFCPCSWDRREAISSSLLNSPRRKFLNESHVIVHFLFLDHHVAASPRRRREASRVFIRSSKNRRNVASQSSMNVSGFPVGHRKTLVESVRCSVAPFQLWRKGSTWPFGQGHVRIFRWCASRRCLGAAECFSTLGSTKIVAEARPGHPGLGWLDLVRGFWFHSAGWVGLGFFGLCHFSKATCPTFPGANW